MQQQIDQDSVLAKRLLQDSSDQAVVWEDPDDEEVQVDLSQKARLRKLMRKSGKDQVSGQEYSKILKDYQQSKFDGLRYSDWTNKWTKKSAQGDEDIQNKGGRLSKMLKSDAFYSTEDDALFSQNIIDVFKLTTSTYSDQLKSVVQTIDIHPTQESRILAGGFDKHLKFYDIEYQSEFDTHNLTHKSSLFFDKFPIKHAQFLNTYKEEIILSSSKRKHLVFYDVERQKSETLPNVFFYKKLGFSKNSIDSFTVSPEGSMLALHTVNNSGEVGILHCKSKKLLFDLKMNEKMTSARFSDEHTLVTAGKKGFVYIWDLRMRRIVNRIKDVGSVSISSLSLANGLLAAGSSAGVLNLYNFQEFAKSNQQSPPVPLRTFNNLSTEVTGIELSRNESSPLMTFCSKWEKGALKVANTEKLLVYKNWPNFKTKINLLSAMRLDNQGRKLLLGDESGKVTVYRLGK